MDFRIWSGDHRDDKGKVFTTHVSKQAVSVVARAGDQLIYGRLYLMPERHVRDELNEGDPFLALAEAVVLEAHSRVELYRAPLIISLRDPDGLNMSRVDWVAPDGLSTTGGHSTNGDLKSGSDSNGPEADRKPDGPAG